MNVTAGAATPSAMAQGEEDKSALRPPFRGAVLVTERVG